MVLADWVVLAGRKTVVVVAAVVVVELVVSKAVRVVLVDRGVAKEVELEVVCKSAVPPAMAVVGHTLAVDTAPAMALALVPAIPSALVFVTSLAKRALAAPPTASPTAPPATAPPRDSVLPATAPSVPVPLVLRELLPAVILLSPAVPLAPPVPAVPKQLSHPLPCFSFLRSTRC